MAEHIMDLICGNKKYYISHSGETVYYSTSGRGRGSTVVKGVKFKNNTIKDFSGNKLTETQICMKLP